eukprot:scaffold17514_cov64-Phaeocystis_antarctica.AAC.1
MALRSYVRQSAKYGICGPKTATLFYLLRDATSRSAGSGEASAAAIETIIATQLVELAARRNRDVPVDWEQRHACVARLDPSAGWG